MSAQYPIDIDHIRSLAQNKSGEQNTPALVFLLNTTNNTFDQVYPNTNINQHPQEPSFDGTNNTPVFSDATLVGWLEGWFENAREIRTAIETAYKIHFLEKRIQDSEIIARIAQGVNITIRFDDTLELIFAQTSRLIPNTEFRILLLEERAERFYYDFFVSDDERVSENEKGYLFEVPPHELAVIKDRKSFSGQITAASGKPLNFIGAPLNAGSKTIGAICLYDRSRSYTTRHIELLQTIADHTAGAVHKERLLSESSKRAQQFAKLNEVGRVLTSTLEIDKLLSTVLENVVSYMEASDGNISLIDESTGDLVIKASTFEAPIKEQAEGKYDLTVPLVVKNEVIGALELFGGKNGKLFNEEDQNLLSAFASHAAIALENARLYTLTDQSLAMRVEELSIMQRIDQELNTHLDLSSAAKTTLRWAMNYSELEYGFIGLWEENELAIFDHVSQNYAAAELSTFIVDHAKLFQADSVISFTKGAGDQDQAFLFPNSTLGFIVPIFRESTPIGVIYMEGETPPYKKISELSGFLKRLADHATTAITNGQLLKQLSDSNTAKSEFVSFVAHELKNPMTSIKGYSELMAAGAAGPLTDTQVSFLDIIKNNVDRMKTIVEDLNDITKIEAGRLRLDFKKVEVQELIDPALRSTQKQLSEKNQHIQTNITGDLPALWVDKTRSEQILVNLLINANKYTPEGGTIWLEAKLAFEDSEAKMIQFCVRDNGIGISAEDSEKIFTKFFRSEDDRARRSSGTGLGLNISQNLARMQGGDIWFESEPDKGSSFYFTLPVASA